MKYSLTLTDDSRDSVVQAILAPLVEFNNLRAGDGNSRPLTIAVRNDADQIIGGLSGRTSRGWLFTQFLVVPEMHRGQGIGRTIMEMAENEAIARGCVGSWLDTFDFQAPAFYERLGYTSFGRIDNYPVGHTRFFFQKVLRQSYPSYFAGTTQDHSCTDFC